MPALFAALLALTPYAEIPRDRVSLVELNHYFNDEGAHQYDQAIFWDWHSEDSAFRVRAWRLIRDGKPSKNVVAPGWSCVWKDSGNHNSRAVLRRVDGDSYRETWTQFDPEQVDRQFLPEEKRRGLSEPRPRAPGNASPRPSPEE